MKKVLVGLSGGVDSAAAAILLIKAGYKVAAITMRIFQNNIALKNNMVSGGCFGPDTNDVESAKKIADILGIRFYTVDLALEYDNKVLSNFRNEYLHGRTPNPCILCNRYIKFDALIDKAKKMGIEFDYFATGHYARIEFSKKYKRYVLKKAKTPIRDQSYFLAMLKKERFDRLIFPLAEYSKNEIREIVKGNGLSVYNKKDSQDFYSGNYSDLFNNPEFMKNTIKNGEHSGLIKTIDGRVVGKHNGIWKYTLGQRRGIGVSMGEPYYVVKLDSRTRTVYIGKDKELLSSALIAENPNWLLFKELTETLEVRAKLRSTQQDFPAVIEPIDNKIKMTFKVPQRAVTPGQIVVFYRQDIVIGGAYIKETIY